MTHQKEGIKQKLPAALARVRGIAEGVLGHSLEEPKPGATSRPVAKSGTFVIVVARH